MLFYFLLLITLYILSRTGDGFYEILRKYADCMAGGPRKEHDCHELREDLEVNTNPVLEVMSFFFLAFQNFASLPLVI